MSDAQLLSALGLIFGLSIGLWIVLFIRSEQVYRMRMRLLDEEYAWIRAHIPDIVRLGIPPGFRRQNAMPHDTVMWLQFWRPLRHFEPGPVEDYYPEVARERV